MSFSDSQEEPKMLKVIYSAAYGGFRLSHEAECHLKMLELPISMSGKKSRMNQAVIEALEKFGLEKSSGGRGCKLVVTKIPMEVKDFFTIEEYDGFESVEVNYDKLMASLLDKTMKKLINKEENLNEEIELFISSR